MRLIPTAHVHEAEARGVDERIPAAAVRGEIRVVALQHDCGCCLRPSQERELPIGYELSDGDLDVLRGGVRWRPRIRSKLR